VESVAWVAERKDLLSTLFWILTIWAYARYVEQPSRPRYSVALLFFALGLMTKPMLVTLPFVLLLLDYWPLGRLSSKSTEETKALRVQLVREKIPFFALSLLSCLATIWAQSAGGAIKSLETIPLGLRFANAIASYGAYLLKTLWPADLAVLYPIPKEVPMIAALCSAVALVLITFFVMRQRQRQPALLAGWLWYLGTLVPVIGLVQVGSQAMADRYTYVPLIGIFVLVVWGLGDWRVTWQHARPVKLAFAGFTLTWLVSTTVHQIFYWQTGATLFSHTAGVTKGNSVAHNNLGTALSTQGRTSEAIEQFTEALRIKPDYAAAHFNIATELATQGRVTQAVHHLNEILRLKPNEAEVHNNLGVLLAREGQYQEAIEHFNMAIRIKPAYSKPHLNLAMAYEKLGKTAEASARYRLARRLEGKPESDTD
jgi:tetratricopeptide (TPR) repeat protein